MKKEVLVTIDENKLEAVAGGGYGHSNNNGGGLIGGLLGLVGGVVKTGLGLVGGVLGALFGGGHKGY